MKSFPLYPVAVVLPFLAGIVVLLDVPPLIWHIRNRNVAAASLVFWILLLNSFTLSNAIIWPRDDIKSWWGGQGLCDVEVKIFVGGTIALPAALACLMRSLANVLDTKIIPSDRSGNNESGGMR